MVKSRYMLYEVGSNSVNAPRINWFALTNNIGKRVSVLTYSLQQVGGMCK